MGGRGVAVAFSGTRQGQWPLYKDYGQPFRKISGRCNLDRNHSSLDCKYTLVHYCHKNCTIAYILVHYCTQIQIASPTPHPEFFGRGGTTNLAWWGTGEGQGPLIQIPCTATLQLSKPQWGATWGFWFSDCRCTIAHILVHYCHKNCTIAYILVHYCTQIPGQHIQGVPKPSENFLRPGRTKYLFQPT